MTKNIILSVMAIVIAATMVVGATTAYFSDVETSNENTITAGTLDLKIDGGDSNVVKFNVDRFMPGGQLRGTYVLKNAGNVGGYLSISGTSVTNLENGIIEPEAEAGDTTENVGELGSITNIRLFVDSDGDGNIDPEDTMIYNGILNNMPRSFPLNLPLTAGQEIRISAVIDWWDTAADNRAQGDTVVFSLSFMLHQRSNEPTLS